MGKRKAKSKRIAVVVVMSMAPHSKAGRTLVKLRKECDLEALLTEALREEYAKSGITGVRVDLVEVKS